MPSTPPPFPSAVEIALGALLLAVSGVHYALVVNYDRVPPRARWGLRLLLLGAAALLLFSVHMRFFR